MLVVDDEQSVVDVLSAAAGSLGVKRVDVARTAEQALGQVVNSRYDLITLDLNMPGRNGLEVLSVLRNLCPHAILAVLSGVLPVTLDEVTRGSADAFIAKPMRLITLKLLTEAAVQIVEAREMVRAVSELPIPTS
jgi:two-component system chemotaxis response regulator CheB